MDLVLLGLICGAVFAGLEFVLILLGRWPGRRETVEVLVASAANRFATGLFIPNLDLGISLWAQGIAVGLLLALPVALVARRTVGPLGLGAVGGITIAALAELAA